MQALNKTQLEEAMDAPEERKNPIFPEVNLGEAFASVKKRLSLENFLSTFENLLGGNKMSTEEKVIEWGLDQLMETYSQQRAFGLSLQSKFSNLSDSNILSTSISYRDDIPKKYRDKILEFRSRVMEIIWGVATQIQDLKFRKLDEEILNESLSKFQERRYMQVRDSQKDLFASYDAIRESINYIHDFNEQLVNKIPQMSGGEKREFLLLNAIIVHELTDSIVELIETFNLGSRETLQKINEQVVLELDAQATRDEELLNRALENKNDVGDFVKKNIQERRNIRELLVKRWEELFTRIDERINSAKSYLPSLKLIRDNARERVTSLEQMGIMRFVEGSLMNFQEICSFSNIKLAPLSIDEVRELIVVPLVTKEEKSETN